MFVLKDKKSGMYVGSHSSKFSQLQIRDHAVEFKDEQEAKDSLEKLKDLPLDLEIISE